MLRIEVSVTGYNKERFERALRRKLLITVNDALADHPDVELNRIQFVKPKAR